MGSSAGTRGGVSKRRCEQRWRTCEGGEGTARVFRDREERGGAMRAEVMADGAALIAGRKRRVDGTTKRIVDGRIRNHFSLFK
jgi:hypothetical protein